MKPAARRVHGWRRGRAWAWPLVSLLLLGAAALLADAAAPAGSAVALAALV